MPTCVPMKDLKNTAKFTATVRESPDPVIVTNNGREAFVSMTPERYDELLLEAARARLYDAIDRSEDDIASGRTADAREALASLRERYGL